MVDIGESGRQNDGGVFAKSNIGICTKNQTLDFPEPEKLRHCDTVLPYDFIGDDAFPMGPNLMKPYPRYNLDDQSKLIANYRFSRARRIIESSCGILAARFRFFRHPVHAKVETVQNITKACVALHNYLMADKSFEKDNYCPPPPPPPDYQAVNGQRYGEWRAVTENDNGLASLTQAGSNDYSKDAKQIKDNFCQYFNSPEGEVPWQYDMISATSRTKYDTHPGIM